MPCGRDGRTSTAPGNSGSTLGTRASAPGGRSRARRGTTARSSSRSRGGGSLSGPHQRKGAPGRGWYPRPFRSPAAFPADHRVWLRFGAVDWRADAWVNGRKVGEHEGGYTPFEFDVTDVIARDAENT